MKPPGKKKKNHRVDDQSLVLFFEYLFIQLCQVLVVAPRIFTALCGIFPCAYRLVVVCRCAGLVAPGHVGFFFPDHGLNPCPPYCKADSQPLDHQGSPQQSLFNQIIIHSVMAAHGQEKFSRKEVSCCYENSDLLKTKKELFIFSEM